MQPERVYEIKSKITSTQLFAKKFISDLQIRTINPTQNIIEFSLKVLPIHTNSLGFMHGGMIASLIDWTSSMAIYSILGKTGVSTDLNVSYVKSVGEGEEVRIKAWCCKVGKTLAFTETRICLGDEVVAFGSHTKFVGSAGKSKL